MRKVLVSLLSIGLISCSMPMLNNTSQYSDLDKEYSQFKTEALTQSYLKKKMDKWLSDTKYSKNLVREIEYAKFKHKDLLKTIVNQNPSMFNSMTANTAVETKRSESSFENYIEYIDPYPSSVTTTSATNVGATGFTANWNSVTGATAYKLYVDANSPIDVGDVTTYDVTGVSANSSHTYKVKAVNANGTSSDSNVITVLTTLPAPLALDGSSFTATGFTANWNTVTGATGYKVYVDDMTSGQAVNKYIITVSGQASTNYAVTGLTSTSNYIYYVKSISTNGESLSSNVISISDLRFGLVAYYPFSGNANDASGYGHNGSVSNATLTTDRFGSTNKAYSFAGNGVITVGSLSQINGNLDWTISFWMKLNAFQDFLNAFDANYTGGNNAGPRFEVNGAGRVGFVIGTDRNNFYGFGLVNQFSVGNWINVVAVKNNGYLSYYVNGVNHDSLIIRSGTINGHIVEGDNYANGIPIYPPTFSNLIIGNGYSTDANRWFRGALDDFRIYNRALTAQEVDALFKE